jgi:hypothetical protein
MGANCQRTAPGHQRHVDQHLRCASLLGFLGNRYGLKNFIISHCLIYDIATLAIAQATTPNDIAFYSMPVALII